LLLFLVEEAPFSVAADCSLGRSRLESWREGMDVESETTDDRTS
jgi:hypothetical protein